MRLKLYLAPGIAPRVTQPNFTERRQRNPRMLKWIDVMTSLLDRKKAASLIQRTSHARTIRVSFRHVCCQRQIATSLHSAKCQQRHQGFTRVRVQVQVLTNPLSTYPRPISCHMLRCIHTNSHPLFSSNCK